MTWFYNLKTSLKLVISFGMMLAMLLAVAWVGQAASAAMRENQQATFNVDLKSVRLSGTIERLRVMSARLTRDGIIETDPAAVEKFKRQREANDAELQRSVDELEKLTADEGSRHEIAAFRSAVPEWEALSLEAVDNSPIGESKGNPAKMMAALHHLVEVGAVLDGHLTAVNEQVMQSARERAANSEAEYLRSRLVSISMVVGVLFLGVLFTLLITRAIAKPLQDSVTVLERVSRGDLTARLNHESKDEIGQLAVALNASLESIMDTLVGVQSIAVEVSTASTELASSAQQISSGAQEQAASLEETAASLEEISSTVKQNTDSAQQASQLSNGARDAAERGGRVVESAVSAMTEITKSSKKIAEIITTIDEIAFQTNLLALNAAVEAARAGEQGRGFGVVAAEVRLLAQRTATAAKEIRGLIADSSSKVEVGTDQVNQSGETLVEIVRSVKRVTDMVAEIAAASREQTTGIEQVNTAVTQVDQVTQLNAAQTEELSATANALSDKASDLRQQVARFQLGATVTAARTPSAASRAKASNVTKLRPSRMAPPKAAPTLKVANGYEEF